MEKKIFEQRILQRFPNLKVKFKNFDLSKYALGMQIDGIEEFFEILNYLKNDPSLYCQQLIDLLVVDYLHYGISEWDVVNVHTHGFNRANNYAIKASINSSDKLKFRFGIVYQLLSLVNNLRFTIEFLLIHDNLIVPSCMQLWPAANWYEREAFDLFGIIFNNHPNLTRIFNDRDFKGYPFRKDFPTAGYVDSRYDAKQQQIVVDPIDLTPNPVIPKVIRIDHIENLT